MAYYAMQFVTGQAGSHMLKQLLAVVFLTNRMLFMLGQSWPTMLCNSRLDKLDLVWSSFYKLLVVLDFDKSFMIGAIVIYYTISFVTA
jgi:hypothetical protein